MRCERTAVRVLASLLLIGSAVVCGEANAERKSITPEAGATGQEAMPNAYLLNLLIRTTLIALNQANQTGNYSVLRDLAAPSFQRANSSAKLAEIFAALRKRNLDLSPILFLEPKLIRQPKIDEAGMLRLSGFMPSEPERVLFDMLFQRLDNRWQLFGISVDVRPPETPKTAGEALSPPTQANTAAPKGKASPPGNIKNSKVKK